jgi:hypothetical protein
VVQKCKLAILLFLFFSFFCLDFIVTLQKRRFTSNGKRGVSSACQKYVVNPIAKHSSKSESAFCSGAYEYKIDPILN